MDNLALAWRAEEACLNAVPSLRQVLLDGWLIRQSGGPIKRANSANPLHNAADDPPRIIAEARRLYASRGHPTIFRIPTIAAAIDPHLESAGFTVEAESCVLFADLAEAAVADEVELIAGASRDWLAARKHMTGSSDADHLIFERLLDVVLAPGIFAAIRREGRIVSAARGIIHDRLLVVDSMATDAAFRQQGLGSLIVGSLLGWARRQRATGACLQVVAGNKAAHPLYRKLGFRTELYRYHYRREREGQDSAR
jgi:GNAT superfamily N-acetyltransferase